MAGADDGDSLRSGDAPVDYIRAKSVRMDDIRTIFSAQGADCPSLGAIVTVSEIERNYNDVIRLE
jgi:hypothetical protein